MNKRMNMNLDEGLDDCLLFKAGCNASMTDLKHLWVAVSGLMTIVLKLVRKQNLH